MKVYVYLADGFEEIEAVTIVDTLRRAEVDVETVSIMEGREVQGAHGIPVRADLSFVEADYQNCGMIVLPGGMGGTLRLKDHAGLSEEIRIFFAEEKWLTAICAAPMVYGALGLLKDRRATCYPGLEKHLIGAHFIANRVVIDGKFVTSQGPGTALDFAFSLVEILCGPEKTEALRLEMISK